MYSLNKIIKTISLIALTFGCFALSPQAQAVCQEGCDASLFSTFLGEDAFEDNTTGVNNTAIGNEALRLNTTGSYNTANGAFALASNTTGSFNAAIGDEALLGNTTGSTNTAIGYSALWTNSGSNNIALGYFAGRSLGQGSNKLCSESEESERSCTRDGLDERKLVPPEEHASACPDRADRVATAIQDSMTHCPSTKGIRRFYRLAHG